MKNNVLRHLALIALLASLGCDPPPDPEDAGNRDAGPGVSTRFDAGRFDAGRFDAGRFDAAVARRDAGPPRCEGVVTSCSLVPRASCTTQEGCRLGGDCEGVSTSCYSLFDSYACSAQDGCYWSFSSRSCSGSARSCYGYSYSSSCSGQRGCSWDSACDGYATSCILLDGFSCERQRGCYLE